MTVNQWKEQCKKGLQGAFLFYGEEDYLKQYYLQELRKHFIKEEATAIFNHICLTAETFHPNQLENAIQSLPVLQDKKLIEVQGVNFEKMKSDVSDPLCAILRELSSYEYAVVVFYTTPDEFHAGILPKIPSKQYKALAEANVSFVAFDRETPSRLIPWVQKHFTHEKVCLSPEDCTYLIERSGRSMSILNNEIEKLCHYAHAHEQSHIGQTEIMQITSIYPEVEAFDFSNALLDGDMETAFSILKNKQSRKEEPTYIVATMVRVYTDLCLIHAMMEEGRTQKEIAIHLKMHAYKVGLYAKSASKRTANWIKKVIQSCYETDLLLKSIPIRPYLALERLLSEIKNME